MLYHIDLTRMLSGAKSSLPPEKRNRSIFTDLMIFLLVYMIATIPQSIVSSACITAVMLSDPAFYELIRSGIEAGTLDQSALNQYILQISENMPSWVYAVTLCVTGLFILASLIYCRFFEKRKAYTLGFTARGCLSEYILGAGSGLVMISLPILVCYFTNCIEITLSETLNPLMIAIFFLAFLLQGMGEEALFRGYLMTSMARKTNIWTAIIISSLAFSLFHMGNSSFGLIAFVNIFLFGVFASVFMLKRGSIWAVSAIHSIWNFAQGNLFGFNVSGNPKFDTVFVSTQAQFGSILHGGDFGPEGGLGVTVILLIALLIALLLPTKKSEYVVEDKSV